MGRHGPEPGDPDARRLAAFERYEILQQETIKARLSGGVQGIGDHIHFRIVYPGRPFLK